MSKSKAKTASKNNPVAREKAREYFHNQQKIRPVKFLSTIRSFLAAEYEASGDLVKSEDGSILTWAQARG